MVAAISIEDRKCGRAMGRKAAKFVEDGSPIVERKLRADGTLADHKNEPWRRVTGITVEQEPFMDRKERRAGIASFFAKIKDEYLAEAVVEAVPAFGTVPVEGRLKGAPVSLADGDFVWAAENQTRKILTLVEQDFNISAHQLNLLAREFRGVTAMELIDGMRLKPLKSALAELLKVYARELWMSPGLYANVLVSDQRLKIWAYESQFFCDPAEEWRKAELYETRAERRLALIEAFDAGWKRGDQARDAFAAKLGFQSFKDLNRACLNVHGKTVRQMAYDVVCDIVEIYLAAEMKTLRELAGIDSESHNVMRARFLYKGDCEPMAGEHWDFWDSCGDAEWRDALYGWLMRCD